jgi:prepilin-type N-terminal cleavage/methylation domain-containing protein
VLKAITRRIRSQGGFTLVELMVTMGVMSIIAGAVINVAMRTFADTAIVQDRRDVFNDGRISLDRLSKQLRQGESIDVALSDAGEVHCSTYINRVATTVVWRVTGGSAPYSLQESRDGGANFATTLSSLVDPDVFTYTQHEGVIDQVTISLDLGTSTSTVNVQSDVILRNA